MSHKSCYGQMFPSDMDNPPADRRVSGKVFAYESQPPIGICAAKRETFVDQQEWDDCLACEEFDHCYRLCLAKLEFDQAVGS
ncbi:hypothetical protein [Aeoliella mucimassa]|uniref:Uncharacterized protein n=1 Tax=Aeoliella mucimassa TaxID=2527972 RepID=A0A518AS17_9BACT|nr:hypothetical protein [Aeoliella mucimassa]QDU57498.1 hypothetical protein Pan181_37150 [Aeoliella mucimassa]